MTSKVIDTIIEPGLVTVVVQHSGHDSFSRSVGPCATRHLRQKVGANGLIAYGFWKPGSPFTRETWEHDDRRDPENGIYITRIPFSFPIHPALAAEITGAQS